MRYRDEEKDGRLELVKTIHSNYETITNSLLSVKVAFMGMCADIECYLKRGLAEKIVLRVDLEPVAVQALKRLYPRLSGLSLNQWNELSQIFLDIRSDNAHLYCNKKIIISDGLRCYLEGVVEPELPIVADGNELTVYGAYYVLILLSQKFQQWPFISSLLSTRNFKDIEKKDFEKFRQSNLHHLQRFSGIGKPGATLETINLNHTLTREMTGIFLLLEEAALNRNTAMQKRASFKTVLKRITVMKEDKAFADRLTDLRNAWFHGCWLGDEVKNSNGEVRKFDFYETIDTLVMLRDKIKDWPRYANVIHQIHEFGAGLLDCRILRMVELTYKVLDVRLLVSSKLQSRVKNLNKAYERFSSMNDRFYQASSRLLNDGPRTWRTAAPKFSTADYQERVTRVDELKIIVFENDNGFDIGSCHTESKRLIFCNADIPDQFKCTVNQKRLEDYSLRPIRQINERINVYQVYQPSTPSHQKKRKENKYEPRKSLSCRYRWISRRKRRGRQTH